MKLIAFVFLSLISNVFFSKNKDLSRARAYFDVKDYSSTIYFYERVPRITDTSDVRKLAESYVNVSELVKAEKWYSKLCRNSCHNSHLIAYSKCLIEEGKYNAAKRSLARTNPVTELSKHYLELCDSAIVWSDLKPIYEVSNLKNLNTSYNEMAPVIHKNGVLFCSDREVIIIKKKDQTTHNPVFNLWMATDSVNFKRPRRWASTLNTLQQDGPCSFTKDFEKVYMSKTILSGKEKEHKPRLYTAEKLPLRWGDKKKFIFNDTLHTFSQPFITKDETILFFVSDMPGGKGGLDIYACFNYDGKWTDPINLGSPINTVGNEIFPFLSDQGDLYFSSDFHLGLGGYDIFKSKQVNGRFKKVENLKAPINSSHNDFSFVTDSLETKVFFTSDRPGGKGGDDLYKAKKR